MFSKHWQSVATIVSYQQHKRNQTTTFQSSYTINRSTRLWNVLSNDLTGNDISLGQFKTGLFQCYRVAAETVYDVDDPRTWKSICLSSNLSCVISCCYLRLSYFISVIRAAVIGESCSVRLAASLCLCLCLWVCLCLVYAFFYMYSMFIGKVK